METLLTFFDLILYFGDIETATSFCEYLYNDTRANTLPDVINACKVTWQETFNY